LTYLDLGRGSFYQVQRNRNLFLSDFSDVHRLDDVPEKADHTDNLNDQHCSLY